MFCWLMFVELQPVTGWLIRADTGAANIIVSFVVFSSCPCDRHPVTLWHNLSKVYTIA